MADPMLRFEHKVVQPLKACGDGTWLLAVSGGVDSLVMAEVLFRWSRLLKVKLRIAHVHHGHSALVTQRRYRDRAQKAVASWCLERQIPFLTNVAERMGPESEAALREYRQNLLRNWAQEVEAEFVVYAHHRDDQLETRLLRLIRGTGAFGLRGMRLKDRGKLRPLLECTRAEIEDYAHWRGLVFCADPSNEKTDSMRNWLRREWLPGLEQRQPGASASLARSLELLSANAVVEPRIPEAPKLDVGLRREFLAGVSRSGREQMIADYLRSLGLKNYSRRHVRELLKRMAAPGKSGRKPISQQNPTFRMLGVVFEVMPDRLRPIME